MPAMSTSNQVGHVSVMKEETLGLLAVQAGGRYIDCTIGGGGHASAILEASAPGGLLLGLDADPAAIDTASRQLAHFGDSVRLVNRNFSALSQTCQELNFAPVHGVLFDLGLSSLQLSAEERGFSFQTEGPLDMRFGPTQEITAGDIINGYSETELANTIWAYGEEPRSRRIARAIVQARPLRTTRELADIIARAAGGGRARIHPATRTFQALRIAVNDELAVLAQGLEQAAGVLGHGGRIVVISYHSLEDRTVKQFFQKETRDCICPPETPACVCGHTASLRIITRSPERPSQEEVRANPRSRSARLRAAEKL